MSSFTAFICQLISINTIIIVFVIAVIVVQYFRSKALRGIPAIWLFAFMFVTLNAIMPIDLTKWYLDRTVYALNYLRQQTSEFDIFSQSDPVFALLNRVMFDLKLSANAFLGIIAAGYIGAYFATCKILAGHKNGGVIVLFAMVISSFFFESYATNTIRAGLAMSLAILAIAKYYEQQIWAAAIIAVLAIGIHLSVALTIIAFIAAILIRKPKVCFCIWAIAIVASFDAGSYFKEFFASIVSDDRADLYLLASDKEAALRYNIGFRWDFITFSLYPILLGYYYIYRRKFKDKFYNILFCTYLIANAVWILVITAPFSDRFAYLSWALMPFLIAYPLIKGSLFTNNNLKIDLALLVNLAMLAVL